MDGKITEIGAYYDSAHLNERVERRGSQTERAGMKMLCTL